MTIASDNYASNRVGALNISQSLSLDFLILFYDIFLGASALVIRACRG